MIQPVAAIECLVLGATDTSLRFIGDLSITWGGILACASAIAAFALYRRESFDLPGRLGWILPALRALAIWLAVLTLTGPVLHHRKEVGELGRVRLLLDTSQSMGVMDPQMPLSRKLLSACDQGWLPRAAFDTSLHELTLRVSDLRSSLTKFATVEATTANSANETTTTAADEAISISKVLANQRPVESATNSNSDRTALADQFQEQVVSQLSILARQAVDSDDEIEARKSELLGIAGKLQRFENACIKLFETDAKQWADEQGESADVALQMFEQATRLRRLETRLLDTDKGLVAKLKAKHHVELMAVVGEQVTSVWESRSNEPLPASFDDLVSAASTNLTVGLLDKQNQSSGDAVGDQRQRGATVLFSDGQHNRGASPLQVAGVAQSHQTSIFTVGYGYQNEPTDLALISVEYPDTVHKRDRIRGSLVIKDRMPAGTPFVASIAYGDETVWQQELKALDVAQRRIDFEFPIEGIVEGASEKFESGVDHNSLPIKFTAKIVPVEGESETTNNTRAMHIAAITQRQRILMIDGRSRWETRYLRNLFERDSSWEINTVIAGAGTENVALPIGDSDGMFPKTRDDLFEYHLIVYGDVSAKLFSAEQTTWLREFVDQRGGGVIFVDGRRGNLRKFDTATLGPLLPVEWSANARPEKCQRLELTEVGASNASLTFEADPNENEKFWRTLPAPHRVSRVEPLPGSEVLAEAVLGEGKSPAIVTRNFGSGRVMYFAFDETWRWRYGESDKYHQRFWNQVARWAMPRPFAVSDEYLSIDTGKPRYDAGDVAPLRARLRGNDGELVLGATVDALLWKDDRVVATVNLVPDESMPGNYLAQSPPLESGDYSVSIRASGFSESAFQATGTFVVDKSRNRELERIACDEELLSDLAEAGGGQFLREEEVGRLVELLKPLSNGRIVETETVLWKNYWWFCPIIGLLAIEWYLRKRNGLL